RAHHVLLGLALRPERPQLRERERGHHRAGPGPEVLRRELLPGDLAEVVVHVLGTDVADLAVVAGVLEEVLAWEIPALLDDPGEPPVAEVHATALSALPHELERDGVAPDLHVAVAHGGWAVGAVLLRLLVVDY